MQSKKHSMLEALANTFAGMLISALTSQALYWYYDIPVSPALNIWFTVIFTVISIVRGYVLRRLFNKLPSDGRRIR